MRVLVLTRIFPNPLEPLSAPFNRQQIAALAARCDVEVLAPVPWFPGARVFGRRLRAGRLADVDRRTRVGDVSVAHPRALYLPVVGAPLATPLLELSIGRLVERERGRCDVVLGSWVHPDGCAAIRLAERIGVPCVVKAHGTDVNELARRRDVAPIVRALLPHADAAVAPSRPLVRALVELGAPADRTVHVPNGVDRTIFRPNDRAAARAALGLNPSERLVVFVGRLVREKGVEELLVAHAELPGVRLAVVGDGPLRERLARAPRVLAPGAVPLPEVARWLAAADVVTLPSWSEGTPNAVLEALASGRPVVATRVGGIPDVVDDRVGLLVPARGASALAAALGRALDRNWSPTAIAALGPPSWAESGAMLEHVLREAVARSKRRHAAA